MFNKKLAASQQPLLTDMLPNELVGIVFNNTAVGCLKTFSMVCRTWHAIACSCMLSYTLTAEEAGLLHMRWYSDFWALKENSANPSWMFRLLYTQVLKRLQCYHSQQRASFAVMQLCGNNYINVKEIHGVRRSEEGGGLQAHMFKQITVKNYVTGIDTSAVCTTWTETLEYVCAMLTDISVFGKAWFHSVLSQHVAFNPATLQKFKTMRDAALALRFDNRDITMFYHLSSFMDIATRAPVFTPSLHDGRLRFYRAVPGVTLRQLAQLAELTFGLKASTKFGLCVPWVQQVGMHVYYPVNCRLATLVHRRFTHEGPPSYADLCNSIREIEANTFKPTNTRFRFPVMQTCDEFADHLETYLQNKIV